MTQLQLPSLAKGLGLEPDDGVAPGLRLPQLAAWSGDQDADQSLSMMAHDANGSFPSSQNRKKTAADFADRRKVPRLDPEDPATYQKLAPTIDRIKQQSSTWGSFLDGLQKVLDVVDIPRMAVNKALNLVIGAKASSPESSILGGERVYGADVMKKFGIDNRAGQ